MTSQLNRFNRIAIVYDLLAKIVFGKSMRWAQTFFLGSISDQSNVLIIGGGTGWIARDLLSVKPSAHIVYIDASDKMLASAKQRLRAYPENIQFIHGTQDDIPEDSEFGTIITNFYVDLFPPDVLNIHIKRIGSHLKADGKWIVTDFVSDRNWHRFLLWVMYRFFKTTAAIHARVLPDWQQLMKTNNFVVIETREFYRGFIRASLYKRNFNE
jgi:ubiquinone/menaquinone biosynthesis C-methylase UbiE